MAGAAGFGPVGCKSGLGGAALLALSACVDTSYQAGPKHPLTMPPPDGRAAIVTVSPHDYQINRLERGEVRPGIHLRVTRLDARDFDYSEGRVAKQAAEAYCATFNRSLDPAAMGRFSVPNSWVFDGDCR